MCKIKIEIIDPISGDDRVEFIEDPGTSCDCDWYREEDLDE